jgi:hypothetical protein
MLFNITSVTKNTFRWLVLGLFLSTIYDLLYFYLKSSEPTEIERGIYSFSVTMSYIAFFLRLLMVIVYWKDSLDFDGIMLGHKVDRVVRNVIV